jgi:hypothetical protein
MLVPPNDLEPLCDYGWAERPPDVRLTVSEVRTALWLSNGVIGSAARLLSVSRNRLNSFVRTSTLLHSEWVEVREQLLDQAEHVVREAVNDPDLKRALPMSQFVLTKLGARRGWGAGRDSAPR